MYTRSQPLVAKASASMVPNNLSVRSNPSTGGSDVLVLHKSVAHVLFSSPEPGCYTDQHVVCKVPSANQQTSFVMILQVSFHSYLFIRLHDEVLWHFVLFISYRIYFYGT